MLNERGVFFSIMVFLLLSVFLSLFEFASEQNYSLKEILNESNAFQKTSDKYANLENNLVNLTTSDAEGLIDQRILPFTYNIDYNLFSLSTEFPVRQSKIDSYLEIVNAFRIFVEDSNYSNEFDSLAVDVNTSLPESWGGSDKNISFAIYPQCLKYSVLDSNTISFDFVCADYNYMSIKKQDLNIVLNSVHDFNSISCSFNGVSTCFDYDFNNMNSQPYVNLVIDDSECPLCELNQNSIRGHFDPSQTSSVTISCSGASCITPAMNFDFNERTMISYTGQRVSFSVLFEMDSIVESFKFNDANYSVENSVFGIRRWN